VVYGEAYGRGMSVSRGQQREGQTSASTECQKPIFKRWAFNLFLKLVTSETDRKSAGRVSRVDCYCSCIICGRNTVPGSQKVSVGVLEPHAAKFLPGTGR